MLNARHELGSNPITEQILTNKSNTKIMKIILNIGLDVGINEPTNQLADTLKLVEAYGII